MATSINPMYKGVVGFQSSFLASPFHAGTDTSLTVMDASVFPPAPNYLTVRMATKSCLVTIQYTGISGDTLKGITVIESDFPVGLTATYPIGSSVYWSLSKKLLDTIIDNIEEIAEHGGGGTEAKWGLITGSLNDQTDLKNALNTKVDKVEGKQLSSNDFTDAEKSKLADIEAGAEVNVIDTLKIHGEPLEIIGKSVDIGVASSNSYGAVKIGNGITVADGVISVSSSGESGIDAITVNGESVTVTNKVAAIPAASSLKSGAMTPADKTKLDSVTSGAEPNVQSDWNATEGDSLILNKPTINSFQISGNKTSEDLGIVKNLTQAEYDALTDEEKRNGTLYCVTDAPGGGTTYSSLPDKPSINSVTLVGNKSLDDLGIVEKSSDSTSRFQLGCDEDGAYMEIEK